MLSIASAVGCGSKTNDHCLHKYFYVIKKSYYIRIYQFWTVLLGLRLNMMLMDVISIDNISLPFYICFCKLKWYIFHLWTSSVKIIRFIISWAVIFCKYFQDGFIRKCIATPKLLVQMTWYFVDRIDFNVFLMS